MAERLEIGNVQGGSSSAPVDPAAGLRRQSALARWAGGRRRIASVRSYSFPMRLLIGTVAVAVAVAAWQLCSDAKIVDPLVASSPSGVISAAVKLTNSGMLGRASLQTLELFLVGFGLSLVSGLVGGIILGWYRGPRAALDPFVSMLYAAPRIAIIPLITVWVGLGFSAQVVIVWLTAVFPILINVSSGVRAIDRNLFEMSRSYLASNREVLATIALPSAVPAIISGIRQGVAQGLIGVVVAEYFVGDNGLGGLIFNSGQELNTGQAFVGVLIFSLAALLMTMSIRKLEQRLDRWRL